MKLTTYNLQFTTLILFFMLPLFIFAQTVDPSKGGEYSYAFRLYYDQGGLYADRDFEIKYEVIPAKFVPELIVLSSPYKAEVINFKNEVATKFEFDPRKGNPTFIKGKITVRGPYIADALKVNFYDYQNRQLLSIFVKDSSFCNDDSSCDENRGENEKTCPNDCKKKHAPIGPLVINPENGGVVSAILYSVVAAGLVIGGWFGWKWWQKKRAVSASTVPPFFPPSNGIES